MASASLARSYPSPHPLSPPLPPLPPRPPPLRPSHQTLIALMMACSTPSVFFRSPLVRHSVTALELLAAVNALVLSLALCVMHVRFVRNDGCAALLTPHQLHPSPVLEFVVLPNVNHFNSVPSSYRFSAERGFLLLSDHSLRAFNISVKRIFVTEHHSCLGHPVQRFLLAHFIGYDTVAINAFARMSRSVANAHGYVLISHNKRLLNLMHSDPIIGIHNLSNLHRFLILIAWKAGAVMTAVFIMCTTAGLVHFSLKEVQMRMINLTMHLQLVMRSQQSYGRVLVQYAVDALVFVPIIAGMLFFLFEFFDDQALAFAVLIIAWLCAFAASGSTRHWVSRLYLPRLFFCHFGAFHVYFFSFPLGFSWLAFTTSIAHMLHAALTIWNHCELPLLRREHNRQTPD